MTRIVAYALAACTAIYVLVLGIHLAHAQALPYEKGRGQCAGSYVQSGGFCAPKQGNAAPAIPKPRNAQCPSGWFQSGDSCQRMR